MSRSGYLEVMNQKSDVLTDKEVIDYAVKLIAKAREKGQEESHSVRLISDLARRLEVANFRLDRSDDLIQIFYRVGKGVSPINYAAWRKLLDVLSVELAGSLVEGAET